MPRYSRPYPPRPVYGGYYRPYYRPYYYSSFYYPYYYPGFYSPFYFGFSWGYPYSYAPYYYAPYGYGPYAYAPYYGPIVYDTASARLQVTPRNTQVYVDGYFAGLVDEFDGYTLTGNDRIADGACVTSAALPSGAVIVAVYEVGAPAIFGERAVIAGDEETPGVWSAFKLNSMDGARCV